MIQTFNIDVFIQVVSNAETLVGRFTLEVGQAGKQSEYLLSLTFLSRMQNIDADRNDA